MAQSIPPKVNPGDLITASFMDQIIDALSGLDQRVSKLESTGAVTNPVQITGFTATQPIRIGDQIEVDGAGFLVPAILNQVTMGGVLVTSFAFSSNGQKLVFNVPTIPSVTPAGTSVTVTVTNANGSATSQPIIVQSAVVAPVGKITLIFASAPVMPLGQPNITTGQIYQFGFSLTAVTNLSGNYALTPSVTGAGWSAQLVDSSPMSIGAGATATIRVNVTAGTGSGTLSLSAIETTTGSQVTPGNAQVTITTGSPPPTPETRARVTLAGASLGAAVSGTGVTFTRNSLGAVGFTVQLTSIGNYSVSAAMLSPQGWTLGGIDVPTFNVTTPPPSGTTANQNVNLTFTAGTGAANTSLVFTLTGINTGGTTISVTYSLPVTVTG
jgi:hypothetical protein